ncbi:cupredoxin domain-containing protein [Sorangium sp. So ce1000]|uniref:cupredoxin domain-containing protein n=1 Tax=Sorangium sp. So ce1000 TaxID=3133325 RepID=UPI003F624E40
MKTTHAILSIALGITSGASMLGCSQPASAEPQKAPRVVEIMVHGAFVPDTIAAVEGERLQLKLVRHDSGGCTQEIVFPSLGIRKELPTGQPVTIDLPELKAGELKFECGMGMIKGTIAVAPRK